ncbi:hypothetical protein [Streptomyces sp. NPDC127114]|uniref:hypothetical protein n=1 Tax=Streptomyces sp. NPDC127114 TaxID=3345366 RepID=UPI003644A948
MTLDLPGDKHERQILWRTDPRTGEESVPGPVGRPGRIHVGQEGAHRAGSDPVMLANHLSEGADRLDVVQEVEGGITGALRHHLLEPL